MNVQIDDYTVKIDKDDFDYFNSKQWKIVLKNGVPYVYCHVKGKIIYYYREILNAKQGELIDHINGDTLDNRKTNLRLADKRRNAQNMKSNKNCTSKFKGVCWDKNRKKWRANIKVEGKQTHLGRYDSEIEAAKAYNSAASKNFGKFARLNVI